MPARPSISPGVSTPPGCGAERAVAVDAGEELPGDAVRRGAGARGEQRSCARPIPDSCLSQVRAAWRGEQALAGEQLRR